MTEPDTTVK